MKIHERQRIEEMIQRESKVVKGVVSRRSDDVHGLGFGNVKTGFVNTKKLTFLQRASSVDRSEQLRVDSPLLDRRGRELRVTFAETDDNNRSSSHLSSSPAHSP